MKKDFYTITITSKDVKVDKTDSGQLIDKIAMALDEWTENDLMENNIDADWDMQQHFVKEFDMENGLLEAIARMEKRSRMDIEAMITELVDGKRNFNFIPYIRKTYPKLQIGAAIALEDPEAWKIMLDSFEEKVSESSYYDEESYMATYCPELAKNIREAVHDQMRGWNHDRIFGDRDQQGIIRKFGKSLNLDGGLDYDMEKDEIVISWKPDEAREYIRGGDMDDTSRITLKGLKSAVIGEIERGQELVSAKHKAESAARQEERERVKKYQEEQAAQEEIERVAKLKAMKR